MPPNTRLLVKWWGLPYADCTWETIDGHDDFAMLLERYTQFDHESLKRPYSVPPSLANVDESNKPSKGVQCVARWLLATWFEKEGVCFVDNSPLCMQARRGRSQLYRRSKAPVRRTRAVSHHRRRERAGALVPRVQSYCARRERRRVWRLINVSRDGAAARMVLCRCLTRCDQRRINSSLQRSHHDALNGGAGRRALAASSMGIRHHGGERAKVHRRDELIDV